MAYQRLLQVADWFAGERYSSKLRDYLSLHSIVLSPEEGAACEACMSESVEFAPHRRCAGCLAAFLEHRVDWDGWDGSRAREDLDERCAFCMRTWAAMPEEDRGELETWAPRLGICNRCDRELGWNANWCSACNERLDPCADARFSVSLPWMQFGVCPRCAESRGREGARFSRATTACVWCERKGDGTVDEVADYDTREASARVCAAHAYERFWHPNRREAALPGHAAWLVRGYPGVAPRIAKKMRQQQRK